MPRLYEEFEMMMGETQVKFSAWQSQKGDISDKLSIKYQTCDSENLNYSKVYDAGIKLSLTEWQHFQHDINPSAPLHYVLRTTPGDELINLPCAVYLTVRGETTHLGRGNSWNGYRFGDQVVKLSSIVPYIWQNSHAYLSVAESHVQAMREVAINLKMSAHPKLTGRVAWITDVTEVGQKVALTMPYLAPIEKLTQEQAEYLEETIHRMHRLGYAYLDQEIGFGLDDLTNMPSIYDFSTVRHRSETQTKQGWSQWIEDDLLTISTMFKRAGLKPSSSMEVRGKIRKRRHDKFMESICRDD